VRTLPAARCCMLRSARCPCCAGGPCLLHVAQCRMLHSAECPCCAGGPCLLHVALGRVLLNCGRLAAAFDTRPIPCFVGPVCVACLFAVWLCLQLHGMGIHDCQLPVHLILYSCLFMLAAGWHGDSQTTASHTSGPSSLFGSWCHFSLAPST